MAGLGHGRKVNCHEGEDKLNLKLMGADVRRLTPSPGHADPDLSPAAGRRDILHELALV
jgi:hypothetical protein